MSPALETMWSRSTGFGARNCLRENAKSCRDEVEAVLDKSAVENVIQWRQAGRGPFFSTHQPVALSFCRHGTAGSLNPGPGR